MAKGLVVIEAPGKVSTLTAVLRGLGYGWSVVATRGHFCRSPASLWPLEVTSKYEETARHADVRVQRELRVAAKNRTVFVATDDDAEGDVIARDVAAALQGVATQITRIRIRSITPAGVREALGAHEPVDPRQARQGDARRILDRLIGHTFSRKGAPAGRILTPMLASMRRRAPVVGVVRLVVASADGGAPWRAEVPFTAAEREMWEQRALDLATHEGVSAVQCEWLPPQAAWSYTELVTALCGRAVPLDVGRAFRTREEALCV